MSVAMYMRCRRLLCWMILALGVLHLHPAVSQQQDAGQLFFEGFELLNQGKAKEAAAKFEAGLKREPKNALAHFYLAEAYRTLGDKALALEQYQKSLDHDAKSQVAEAAKGFIAELSGKPLVKPYQSGMKPGSEFRDCEECPLMVIIPPGKFVMGSPPSELDRDDDEGPPRIVTIAYAFAVGKFEVTFDEWDACVAARACETVDDGSSGRGKRPVIKVSWTDANAYVKWLAYYKMDKQYRLLSEAEWEYAARAGTNTIRYWGGGADIACEYANVANPKTAETAWWKLELGKPFSCADGFNFGTAPVGTYKPNAFGLHDTLGNVWEWVEDCYNATYAGGPSDGRAWTAGDCSRRVSRGGSWNIYPAFVRSAKRFGNVHSIRSANLGFRIARTLP